jgi:streptomycin 6-kinase
MGESRHDPMIAGIGEKVEPARPSLTWIGDLVGMPLTIPRYLAESIATQTDGDRRPWLAALPETVTGLADRWSLEVAEPFEPGGTASWVAPARDAKGRDLVLKVQWRHYETDHEAAGLRLWAPHGAVGVLAEHETEDTQAFLLERCRPGTSLKDALPEQAQDEVLCGLLRRLWIEPPPGHPFRPLQQMCDDWADAFERRSRPDDLDPGIAREGIATWRRLAREPSRDVLLATDLHAMNVLAAEREPWLVIDVKPYVGDRHYDPLQHMFNCESRLVADPHGFAQRMADLLELDAERLLLWVFARTVVEHEWWPDLRDLAARLAP